MGLVYQVSGIIQLVSTTRDTGWEPQKSRLRKFVGLEPYMTISWNISEFGCAPFLFFFKFEIP